MIEIEKPRIETVQLTNDGTYGKFVMEPLERGYATTLGNSMRRVLLSILPGVAVTSVKIDGVVHEFSTIPGVKEDVTEIILNIKGLIAKLHADTAKKIYIGYSPKSILMILFDSIVSTNGCIVIPPTSNRVNLMQPYLHLQRRYSPQDPQLCQGNLHHLLAERFCRASSAFSALFS